LEESEKTSALPEAPQPDLARNSLVIGLIALAAFAVVVVGVALPGVTAWLTDHIITATIAIPLAGAVAMMFVRSEDERFLRHLTLAFTAVPLALATVMFWLFDLKEKGFQFQEQYRWIPRIGISYHVGIDGQSILLLGMTALLVFLGVLVSRNLSHRPRTYFGLLMLLEAGLLGVFSSLDLILFYIFWETVFIPTYLLIGIWGGPKREAAALKFLIFMLLGSLVMLIGLLLVYFKSGLSPLTFDIPLLAATDIPMDMQRLAFAALFVGFAVKVPIFPFHTWLPDAYTEAPTTVTILMSGALAAMGTYGFLRLALPILPEGSRAFGPVLAVLAVVNVIYGDLVASAQRDLKRMAAYSSISHMGFATLGIVSFTLRGLQGASLHMFNHGIIMGMFFLCVGLIRRHIGERDIGQIRGMLAAVPVLGALFWFASLASFGMPGMSGFVGELIIFLGAYQTRPALAVVALLGAIIMAGYIFWMLTRISFGEALSTAKALDIRPVERFALGTLAATILVLGFYPLLALERITPSLPHLLARLGMP